VQSVQLKVNGDDVNEPALPSPANYYSKAVRVDSTKYDHGGPFELEWKVTFLLARTSPPETKTTTLTVVVEKEVHNLALLTRTTVESNNQQSSDPASYTSVASSGVADAKSKFESVNHSVPSSLTHTKSEFLAALTSASVLFAFTHGSLDGIWVTNMDSGNFVGWSHMANDASFPNSIYPGRNLAIFYACSTNPSSYAGTAALGLMADSSTVRQNAGMLGFQFEVWSMLKSGDQTEYLDEIDLEHHLSEHSKCVIEELATGATVAAAMAVANANESARTRVVNQDPPMKYLPMIAKADLLARLHKVYEGGGGTAQVVTDHYLIFDAPPIGGGPR